MCISVGKGCHIDQSFMCVQDPSKVGCQGNILLDRAMGSTIVLLPPLSFKGKEGAPGLENKLEKYRTYLE